MKRIICHTLCLIFTVLLLIPMLSACGKDKNIYELGEYAITEKEYNYLMGMFKKRALASLGGSLTDDSFETEIGDGHTFGEYFEARYRDGFEQSVMTLLYSQSLFDELGLSLTDEEKSTINATATAIIAYYGNYNEGEFNKLAKDYGFDDEAMRHVYEMQFKENKVRQHLLGIDNESIKESEREEYYQETYLRYKMLIVNTLYKLHTDSSGEVKFVLLDEYEKAERELLSKELRELLVNKNMEYDYILLKDDLSLSFDELWEKYSDDTYYPGGIYGPAHPTEEQLSGSNTLSAAYESKVGEVKVVTAKRYFEGNASLEDGNTTIKPGDYFEYGDVFVKRLELNEGGYDKKANREFFGESFEAGVANAVYYKAILNHADSLPYDIMISDKLAEYTFASVKSNELDYYFFEGDE